MMFLFKPKVINLDCFTASSITYKATPIAPAYRFMPDWWKQIPKEQPRTMRNCAGLIDLYKRGVVIPMWSDLEVKIDEENYQWKFADQTSVIEAHDSIQSGSLMSESNTLHLKLNSPWQFVCKEDIYWHFSQPVWNDFASRDYCIPTGILEFKVQHTSNINILFRKSVKNFLIKHNHPLAHIVPLSERQIKIHNHLVSDAEYGKLLSKPITFNRNYYKVLSAIKSQSAKCPFKEKNNG